MPVSKLLIANRGEIAIRIARTAAELGVPTVAVHSDDDANCRHLLHASAVHRLPGSGPAAYLDANHLIEAAQQHDCDALHPGYGFLSENAAFARQCSEAGIRFVGPRPEVLAELGDKLRAREIAVRCGVPVLDATDGPTSLDDAHHFLRSLGPGAAVAVKAVAGGGGRGLRIVRDAAELDAAYARARSEAGAAFGHDEVYVERALLPARHIEIQIVGDGKQARHLGERECSLQRRHQKIVEIAPSPTLDPALRDRLCTCSVRMAESLGYESLGTFEFLVGPDGDFAFIESNPRLQVEHTITEAVLGIDLVRLQLELAGGAYLDELDLPATSNAIRGYALQLRVNLETMQADGSVLPAGGRLSPCVFPSGPGIRVDTYAYDGYTTNPRFDSLIAKVVVRSESPRYSDAIARARRALDELHLGGSASNIPFLRRLLRHPAIVTNDVDTEFVQRHAAELVRDDDTHSEAARPESAGTSVDKNNPLAVLELGRRSTPAPIVAAKHDDSPGAVRAPLQGTVVDIGVAEGDSVSRGQTLIVLEAMKMEHVVLAPAAGVVRTVSAVVGHAVLAGGVLLVLDETEASATAVETSETIDLEFVRPDLAEALERHAFGYDEQREEAVQRRHATGQRTARENLADLCDPGSFVEYGSLVIAAQRRRRPVDELIRKTPADGLVSGIGSVNGELFPDRDTRCVVLSYDYMVLAGTQGLQNHRKKDRMFELAREHRLPVVFFTEGGGGRPGDTDGMGVAGLDCLAFRYFAELSGHVPLVGINSGRCFAGNAALLGSCDVVIATRNSNIGMGGPAMIEGGGLGVFRPEEIGPIEVQVANGVVDIAVEDEAEAVRVAKRYLSYFQGDLTTHACEDQRLLRHLIPENRLRVYDVRRVIETLADTESVLELRAGWAPGMITSLVRIEGRALGVIANNPMHLGGAIDSEGADKAARFLQLCDAFGLPVLFLCDTPGIMVGPEAEKSGTVRHAARLFVTGASVSVPIGTIVLRKGYGLGAQAMAGGSFHSSSFTIAWPTGEFGGMGLEGAVKLGFRKELEAIEDRAERKRVFDEMVAHAYAIGKGVNMASHFEIDDVIDPTESRQWIRTLLTAHTGQPGGGRRPCVDPW